MKPTKLVLKFIILLLTTAISLCALALATIDLMDGRIKAYQIIGAPFWIFSIITFSLFYIKEIDNEL